LVESRRGGVFACGASRFDPADDRTAKLGVRDAETLEQPTGLRLVVASKREQYMLGADVGGFQRARLLIRSEESSLRVGRERGRHVCSFGPLGLFLDLGRDRLRVGVDLRENMPDDIVLQRRVQ